MFDAHIGITAKLIPETLVQYCSITESRSIIHCSPRRRKSRFHHLHDLRWPFIPKVGKFNKLARNYYTMKKYKKDSMRSRPNSALLVISIFTSKYSKLCVTRILGDRKKVMQKFDSIDDHTKSSDCHLANPTGYVRGMRQGLYYRSRIMMNSNMAIVQFPRLFLNISRNNYSTF